MTDAVTDPETLEISPLIEDLILKIKNLTSINYKQFIVHLLSIEGLNSREEAYVALLCHGVLARQGRNHKSTIISMITELDPDNKRGFKSVCVQATLQVFATLSSHAAKGYVFDHRKFVDNNIVEDMALFLFKEDLDILPAMAVDLINRYQAPEMVPPLLKRVANKDFSLLGEYMHLEEPAGNIPIFVVQWPPKWV